MRIFLRVMCLSVCLLAFQGELWAQPVAGSQLSPDENACAMCHGEADLWEEDQARLFISEEKLATDVHFLKGVNCHDCHGGDPSVFDPGDIHAAEDGFLASLDDVWKACAKCHEKETSEMTTGVHGQTPEVSEPDRAIPLDCIACHGPKAHGMLSVRESRSPVYLDNQIRLCGNCHEEDRDTYFDNEHGHALVHSGLSVTARTASTRRRTSVPRSIRKAPAQPAESATSSSRNDSRRAFTVGSRRAKKQREKHRTKK